MLLFSPFRTTDSLSAFYAGGVSVNAFFHSDKWRVRIFPVSPVARYRGDLQGAMI